LKDPSAFHERLERLEQFPDEEFNHVVELADGRFINVTSAPIQDDGPPKGRIWLFGEFSEEGMDGQLVSTGEIRYRTLFEHFPLGVISCNSQGDVTEVNQEVWRILAAKRPETLESFNILNSHIMINAGISSAVKHCLDTGETFMGDIKYKTAQGEEVFAKLYVAAVQGDSERTVGAVSVLEDISDQKRAEDLVLHSQRLKALGQMAGGVTHSFSNHLQVITGNTNMALTNLDTESYKDLRPHLEQILEAAKSAGDIVRRLQLLSREKSAADSSKRAPLDIGLVVHEAVEMCKLWAKGYLEKKKISVTYKLDLGKGLFVEANQDDIIEIVLNLLKNAVEALDSNGTIRVSVSGDSAHVFIRVRDDGVGIAKQDIDNIVAPFWTSKSGHAGMGLAVNASLVRSYGGGIAIKRVKPKGAIFTVRLPRVKPPQEKTSSAIPPPSERRCRILLIDDDRPVVNILGKGLTRLGNKTFVAFSGQQGLEILEEHEVDAIVCDLGMEGMDGWEVSGEVLSVCVEKGIAKPPFILLTGWAGQLAEDEILYHPHVDRIVEKPITIINLLEIIHKEIERASAH
jgi:PAS domain S-box-containing protein